MVLKSAKKICGFENQHLLISNVNHPEFRNLIGKYVLPNFGISDKKMRSFELALMRDTNHIYSYYVLGQYAKEKHDLSLDYGCDGAHIFRIDSFIKITSKDGRIWNRPYFDTTWNDTIPKVLFKSSLNQFSK